ncbi:hypothetical protein ON010_g12578 [Phytophthora cinnamomi]|nr:hypothetical protein ON010_g12578 [Phytophthora cinnamomi]
MDNTPSPRKKQKSYSIRERQHTGLQRTGGAVYSASTAVAAHCSADEAGWWYNRRCCCSEVEDVAFTAVTANKLRSRSEIPRSASLSCAHSRALVHTRTSTGTPQREGAGITALLRNVHVGGHHRRSGGMAKTRGEHLLVLQLPTAAAILHVMPIPAWRRHCSVAFVDESWILFSRIIHIGHIHAPNASFGDLAKDVHKHMQPAGFVAYALCVGPAVATIDGIILDVELQRRGRTSVSRETRVLGAVVSSEERAVEADFGGGRRCPGQHDARRHRGQPLAGQDA